MRYELLRLTKAKKTVGSWVLDDEKRPAIGILAADL